jgi:mannitol/fructose-specific phosphotransferase system IIA component (Ntr-type)
VEDMIQLKNIRIKDEVADWKQAVVEAVAPLIENGYVESRYVDAIIENTAQYGPYYVIAPNIALPHARPEQGVLKSSWPCCYYAIRSNSRKTGMMFDC